MAKITIRAMAYPYPYFQASSGMWVKFIPKVDAIRVGGRKITDTTEKILMMPFCSIPIRPSVASNKNVIFDATKFA